MNRWVFFLILSCRGIQVTAFRSCPDIPKIIRSRLERILSADKTILFPNATIVGVGLIGGAIGLDLKACGLANNIVGVGHRESSLTKAKEMGAVDSWTLDVAEGVKEADIVILATSVSLIERLAKDALPHMKSGSILSDIGSTKSQITSGIEAALTGDVAFVGSHPLAGSEKRGIEGALPGIFQNAACIFTPTAHSTSKSISALTQMWEAFGASVITMSPEEHDRAMSAVSHLPHAIAALLVNSLDSDNSHLAASGFKDTTRIAASDPSLWRDILMSNRDEVLRSLQNFQLLAAELEQMLSAKDGDALLKMLQHAKKMRDRIAHGQS